MTRYGLLGLLFVALAALVHTQHSPALPQENAVLQFQRNQPLLEALVASSVRLVENDADPLHRATVSAEVAGRFADEVERAVRIQDTARAAELGKHLHNLLERGVADNLKIARRQIPRGSTEEANLRKVSERALTVLQPFQGALQRAAATEEQGEVLTMLLDLLQKQATLEQALRPVTAVSER